LVANTAAGLCQKLQHRGLESLAGDQAGGGKCAERPPGCPPAARGVPGLDHTSPRFGDEVFGLNSDATDYHEILRRMVERHQTLEAVEQLFDDGLSLQARAYVMSLIAGQRAQR
jgi:hypothetical protein